MLKTYHIWTVGCQMNEADSHRLAKALECLGLVPEPLMNQADVIALNTCVVRQPVEDKAVARLQSLKGVKRRRPVIIALMGCLVGARPSPRLREQFPFVDVFMPPSDPSPLVDFLESRELIRTAEDHPSPLPGAERGQAVTAFVPVVLGCSHACSYCVIPGRRGAERSRPKSDILEEVRTLAGQGVREITLLGQIVDRYGLDFSDGSDLAGLLESISDIAGILRIRFLTSHPNWITDRLITAMVSLPKVCPYLELPIQSGNDEILARMKRGYTNTDYRRLVNRLRERIPGLGLATDFIVGFPGETEDQFMDSYRLLQEFRFDMVHNARYSPRPHTLAAERYADDVTPVDKERRRLLMEDLFRDISRQKFEALVGQIVPVLIEAREENGRWRGRTPHNRLVFIEEEKNLLGQLVNIKAEHAGRFSLVGRVAEA